MNCPKHAMCHCILKNHMYSKGFQDALKKAAEIVKNSFNNPKYINAVSALDLMAEDILSTKEDTRD